MKIGEEKISRKEYKSLVDEYKSAVMEAPKLLEGIMDTIADDERTENARETFKISLESVIKRKGNRDEYSWFDKLTLRQSPYLLRDDIRSIKQAKTFLKEYGKYQTHLPLDS